MLRGAGAADNPPGPRVRVLGALHLALKALRRAQPRATRRAGGRADGPGTEAMAGELGQNLIYSPGEHQNWLVLWIFFLIFPDI